MKSLNSILRPIVLLILSICLFPVVAAEFVFRIHHFLPPTAVAQRVLIEPWAEKVTRESNGRIEFQIYPAMQLGGKAPQLFDQVREGVVDLVWTLPGYARGRFPIAEVFELPFVAGTAQATSQAAWEFYGKYLMEEFGEVHPILIHTHAPGQFHMRDKPIRRLEDLAGTRIRAPTHAINEALAVMGATPVGMPVPAVSQALSKGVVDGAMLPYEVTLPLKVHQLVNYHSEIGGERGIYTSVFLFAMNKQRYEALPDDLRQVIDNNTGLVLARQAGQLWDQAEQPERAEAAARGNSFNTIEGSELERWRLASKPVISNWIAHMNGLGMDGRQMYEDAATLIARYSR